MSLTIPVQQTTSCSPWIDIQTNRGSVYFTTQQIFQMLLLWHISFVLFYFKWNSSYDFRSLVYALGLGTDL